MSTSIFSVAKPPSRPYVLKLRNEKGTETSIEGVTYLAQESEPISSKKGNPASNQARCHYFSGIPYALAPTNERRFKLPIPVSFSGEATLKDRDIVQTIGERSVTYTTPSGICPQPHVFDFDPSSEDTALWSEDCLRLNIWVPTGTPDSEEKGWPVLFYIHGGFLQHGTPNGCDYIGLYDSPMPDKVVLVLPGYRLNVFGFLASEELAEEANGEPVGNYGFWDLRCALAWTKKHIHLFGGNPDNMTVGGYSAGALSSFYLLAHDLSLPPADRLLNPGTRVLLSSNAPGLQPKPLSHPNKNVLTAQTQFDDLLRHLKVRRGLSAREKCEILRSTPAIKLIRATSRLETQHEFRPTTDGTFITTTLFKEIEEGIFAQRLVASKIQILIGETKDEHYAFAKWRPPPYPIPARYRSKRMVEFLPSPTGKEVRDRFAGEYGQLVASRLSIDVFYVWWPYKTLVEDEQKKRITYIRSENRRTKNRIEEFGQMYADLQVHCLGRGFVDNLIKHGAAKQVKRYQVAWRMKNADLSYPPEMKATHGTDFAVWFWGDGVGLELQQEEHRIVRDFCRGYWTWISGKMTAREWDAWGGDAAKQEMWLLRSDGVSEVSIDSDWDFGLRVWNVARQAQEEEYRGVYRIDPETEHGSVDEIHNNDAPDKDARGDKANDVDKSSTESIAEKKMTVARKRKKLAK